jgi:hypothetical protein
MEDFSVNPTPTSNQYIRKFNISNSVHAEDSKAKTPQQSGWLRSMVDHSSK